MKEIADFLAAHPPFDRLPREEVDRLAATVDVRYHVSGDHVAVPGQPTDGCAVLVRVGRLEVLGPAGTIIDEAGPGDVLGEDEVRAGLPFAYLARAAEDSLVYLVRLPEPLRAGHPILTVSPRSGLTRTERLFDPGHGDVGASMRTVVRHDAATPIDQVARSMTDARTSCSVITGAGTDIGVVTDDDLRRRVATGEVPPSAAVGTIASFPARTIAADALLGEAYLSMVDAGIHHLVVVGAREEPVGVIRVVDVASAELRDPLVVRAAVERAASADELVEAAALLLPSVVELVGRSVPMDYVARLQSGVTDAVVRRAIELTPAAGRLHESSWLVQGSLARREPLPGSDVDTALCWYSGEPADHLAYASTVLRLVERAGFATCDRGANADNPLFNRSSEQWRRAVASWFEHDDLAGALTLASIAADSRTVSGQQVSPLLDAVSVAATQQRFIGVLATHTLSRRPPLGFVRDFVVHHTGEHRGRLDLKKGGLVPITSLARWLVLRTGDASGSTLARLQRASDAGLIDEAQCDMLSGAFKVVLTALGREQVRAIQAGEQPSTFVRPGELNPLDRRQLREAFRAVAAVQSALSSAEWMRRL